MRNVAKCTQEWIRGSTTTTHREKREKGESRNAKQTAGFSCVCACICVYEARTIRLTTRQSLRRQLGCKRTHTIYITAVQKRTTTTAFAGKDDWRKTQMAQRLLIEWHASRSNSFVVASSRMECGLAGGWAAAKSDRLRDRVVV